MTQARKLGLFVLAVCGAFTYLCNVIPQIQVRAAGAKVEIGQTPESLVGAGKRLFAGDRAQCLTCHSLGEDPKARCPDQMGLGERAGKRKPGMDGAAYLIESVYNPDAFVVPGFPKHQMQPVHKPPIALSHDEILAVTSYLNTLGGTTDAAFVARLRAAQDPWRKGLRKPEQPVETDRLPILAGDAAAGAKLFVKHGCDGCHRIGGVGKDVCPDLSSIGASQSAEYILESILEPNAVIVKGYADSVLIFKDGRRTEGRISGWLPSKERPRTVRVLVKSGGSYVERTFELDRVRTLGETGVAYREEGEGRVVYGEYVKGDAKQGLVLRLLEGGRWRERRFPATIIRRIVHPVSPMPDNFGDLMSPREIYDLLAYLLAQKGRAR